MPPFFKLGQKHVGFETKSDPTVPAHNKHPIKSLSVSGTNMGTAGGGSWLVAGHGQRRENELSPHI